MRRRWFVTLWWYAALFLGGCQQQPTPFQLDAIKQDYLTLGKGGGMTNQVDTYYILSDGYVYKHNNLSQVYERLGRLDSQERADCFERARAIPEANFGCQEPGNIYYFLSIHTADTTRSCIWGSQNFTPPEAITSFYQYSQSLIQDVSL